MVLRSPERYWNTSNTEVGLSDEQIDQVERSVNVRFPATLRAMFKVHAGGLLRGKHPQLFTEQFGDHIQAPRKNQEGSLYYDWSPWWKNDEYWQPQGDIRLLIPFGGDGHSDLCLDYRAFGPAEEPTITVASSEMEAETPLAASLDAYLDQIVDETHRCIRVHRDHTLDGLAEFAMRHFGLDEVSDRSDDGFRAVDGGYYEYQQPGFSAYGKSKPFSLIGFFTSRNSQFGFKDQFVIPEDPECGWLLTAYPCTEQDIPSPGCAEGLLELLIADGFKAEFGPI